MQRRVLCNDDGWILSAHEGEPPLTPDMIWEQSIGPRQGTPIDTFLWSVAGNEIYTYETAVGERFGDGYDPSALDGPSARKLNNLRYLQQHHGGALPVHIELAHRAGMRFLASFRMNQHYGSVEDDSPYNFSSMRRERPELAIGRLGETLSPDNLEWGIRTGLNFACEEVRRHHIAICAEMVDCWDVDGIELDFMRHPAYFRISDAVAGGHLLTDMVAAIKAAVDAASFRTGRSMELVVRVPPTIFDCHRIGIEISRWIARGLVDVVVAGEGWIAHTAPIADFVELARQRGLVPGQKSTSKRPLILGPFEALNQTLHPDELNAIAARYWADGVDGLHLFNYYSMSHHWRTTTLAQMADPQGSLRYATKRYRLDLGRGKERPNSTLGFSFMNAVPATILPVELYPSLGGLGCELPLTMVDDPRYVVEVFESVTLGLGLVDYHERSRHVALKLSLNGVVIPWASGVIKQEGWTHTAYSSTTSNNNSWNNYPSQLDSTPVLDVVPVEFDLLYSRGADSQRVIGLRRGANVLEVSLVDTGGGGEPIRPLTLAEVRLTVRYKPHAQKPVARL